MTFSLDNLRAEISKIDQEILSLLSERMNLSKKVAEYKKEKNLPIFDPKRENELLTRYQASVDFDVSSIYRAIMEESKRIQMENE